MFKLAALGAVGYAAYRYYQKNKGAVGSPGSAPRMNAVAGGPLSSQSTLVHNADDLPA